MDTAKCDSCGRVTGHKRSFGLGTVLAIVLTGGFWILAMPAYPKRCVNCGLEKGRVVHPRARVAAGAWRTADKIGLAVLCALVASLGVAFAVVH